MKDFKDNEKDALVTISRQRGDGGECVCIEIQCAKSGAFVRARMELEDYAEVVTGLARTGARTSTIRNLSKWGLKADRKSVTVKAPNHDDRERLEPILIADNCPDGYEPSGRHYSRSGLVLNYIKWEDE